MSAHTPTPWVLVHPVGDEKPSIVNMTADAKVDYYIAEMIGNYKAAGADAAHIVRCVNAHDELVAALSDLLSEVNAAGLGSAKDFGWPAVTAAARAALAKAGVA